MDEDKENISRSDFFPQSTTYREKCQLFFGGYFMTRTIHLPIVSRKKHADRRQKTGWTNEHDQEHSQLFCDIQLNSQLLRITAIFELNLIENNIVVQGEILSKTVECMVSFSLRQRVIYLRQDWRLLIRHAFRCWPFFGFSPCNLHEQLRGVLHLISSSFAQLTWEVEGEIWSTQSGNLPVKLMSKPERFSACVLAWSACFQL